MKPHKARLSFTVVLELDATVASDSDMFSLVQEYEMFLLSKSWESSGAPAGVEQIRETLYMSKIDLAKPRGAMKLG